MRYLSYTIGLDLFAPPSRWGRIMQVLHHRYPDHTSFEPAEISENVLHVDIEPPQLLAESIGEELDTLVALIGPASGLAIVQYIYSEMARRTEQGGYSSLQVRQAVREHKDAQVS